MRNARAATIGFVVLLTLAAVSSLSDIYIVKQVRRHQDVARAQAMSLAEIERLRYFVEKETSATRTYLLTRDEQHLQDVASGHQGFREALADIREVASTAEGRAFLNRISDAAREHQEVLSQLYEHTAEGPLSTYDAQRFSVEVLPIRARLDTLLTTLAVRKLSQVEDANRQTQQFSRGASRLVAGLSAVLLLLGIGLAAYLSRAIRERERAEQRLYEETVEQNQLIQKHIRDLRIERDEALRQIEDLRSKKE